MFDPKDDDNTENQEQETQEESQESQDPENHADQIIDYENRVDDGIFGVMESEEESSP